MIYLSQRDLKWAKEKLGQSNLTIGRWGCTTTCVSMVSDYFGCYRSPIDLAHDAANYTNDGLILWWKLHFLKMKFSSRERLRNDASIQESLKNPNGAVILEVNDGQHWVVALRRAYVGNDYLVLDPWTGKKCWVIKTYRNITGSAHFKRL